MSGSLAVARKPPASAAEAPIKARQPLSDRGGLSASHFAAEVVSTGAGANRSIASRGSATEISPDVARAGLVSSRKTLAPRARRSVSSASPGRKVPPVATNSGARRTTPSASPGSESAPTAAAPASAAVG